MPSRLCFALEVIQVEIFEAFDGLFGQREEEQV